ncbi:MAG: FAD-binding domain-containing protein [Pseudomonadota bacterium]
MEAFAPRMGKRYASGRNYDRGPGQHSAVSTLSPYIRRRVITEQEVVVAALKAHGPEAAEKFVQEVVWRGYFKGWLERRPSIWTAYRDGLTQDQFALDKDRRLRKAVHNAEAGQTGIDCFDAWAEELVETGYLHNHARMWFASIWIFTLELPWRLGADFFYRNLLDGDPASNTLSWRWVAGLHTRGKAYPAEAWNIAKFTNQRFTPRPGELADGIEPLDSTEPEGLPSVTALRSLETPKTGVPTALLITEEDCHLEEFAPHDLNLCASATLTASHLRSDRPVNEIVQAFESQALADMASRLDLTPDRLEARDPADLAKWASKAGAKQIATAFIPQGPLHDWMTAARPALDKANITLTEWQRDWDAALWPHATAGFFKVKKAIPQVLKDLDVETM